MRPSPRPLPDHPREIAVLDEAAWDAPLHLSRDEWLVEAGTDGFRFPGRVTDPEDDQ
jgi:hypothetical protein